MLDTAEDIGGMVPPVPVGPAGADELLKGKGGDEVGAGGLVEIPVPNGAVPVGAIPVGPVPCS